MEAFLRIPGWRQSGKVGISLHDALMSGVACMHFQDRSLLQFQQRMQEDQHRNNLRTLFDVTNIPKARQIREIIDGVDREYFRAIFKAIDSRLQRGKHFWEKMRSWIDIMIFDTWEHLLTFALAPKTGLLQMEALTYSKLMRMVWFLWSRGWLHPDVLDLIIFNPQE